MVSSIRTFFKDISLLHLGAALLILVSLLGGLPLLFSFSIFGAIALGGIISCYKGIKIETLPLIFLLYLPLNLLISQPDPVFRAWQRLALFTAVFIVMSPVNKSRQAIKFRDSTLKALAVGCVFLAVGSFFAYFLGINLMKNYYEGGYLDDYAGNGGHFSGLTNHSMLLGPISAIAGILLFDRYLKSKNRKLLLLLIPCIGSLFFAASRGALIGFVIAIVSMLYYVSKNKKSFLKRILGITILLAVSFPLWQSFTTDISNKQAGRVQEGGTFDSRTTKVEARWDEFVKNPIFGVGFASIDPHGKDYYDRVTGTIEPGTSWLTVLSMLGIIGFLLFVNICKKAFINVKEKRDLFLLGVLTFFLIHFLVEGYIFGAGGPLCSIAWLAIANAYDSKIKNEISIL